MVEAVPCNLTYLGMHEYLPLLLLWDTAIKIFFADENNSPRMITLEKIGAEAAKNLWAKIKGSQRVDSSAFGCFQGIEGPKYARLGHLIGSTRPLLHWADSPTATGTYAPPRPPRPIVRATSPKH